MSAPASSPFKPLPIRKRTGTAAFHLSKKAVDFGQEDLAKLSEKQAVLLLAELTWGSTTEMPCAHCGTVDTHYFSVKELRWKCKCCGKRFSVTSGTVLADHKLSLKKILCMAFTWANGASGLPALQLRREWNVAYGTAFTLVQKLREGLVRGFNVGLLAGVHEMDGMDINGRRYREKRGKPLGGKSGPTPKIPSFLLKPKPGEEPHGPPTPPKWGKASKQPVDRRLVLAMVQRGQSLGLGAVSTRIGIAKTESGATVTTMAMRHASAESAFMTDEDPSYASFGTLFAKHDTINHSESYSRPGGISNNLAESLNARMRRGAEGVYLNQSNKYTHDYSCEQAWRQDTRKLSTGKKLRHLLRVALSVGLSKWWRGYYQGVHRDHEMLLEGNAPAKGRGRPEGWKPKPPR
ncbi:transposase [Caenimonas sp. SL110]|uniref:transposase n=1 Tax=Caenimonas sp. SL110 TaxID=1450524 RepID=UPI000653A7AA|nr:transposase [Caenimonas sp. SL110]